jgi:c-di-GMP-binding flagellar brake protein YcgR
VADNERRIEKRVPFIKEVEVVGIGTRRCSDLSVGGMYLETVAMFPVGTILDLRFKLQDSSEELIQVQARVSYVHSGMGLGLRFIKVTPTDNEKIQKWIDQH